MPLGIRLGSSTTAAATTGPASGPRPASSQPATGQTPRLISARSRRKLGGATAITPFGSLGFVFFGFVANHAGIVRKRARGATGNSAQFPLFRRMIRAISPAINRLSSPTSMPGATTTSQR